MAYRHYLENPMPMVERLINRNLYKKYNLIKSLDGTYLLVHMGAHGTGEADIKDLRKQDKNDIKFKNYNIQLNHLLY